MVCEFRFRCRNPPIGPQSGAGIDNENTRLAYPNDVGDFIRFRRAEASTLMEDIVPRRGIMTLCVHGKGGRILNVRVKPAGIMLIEACLDAAGHRGDTTGPLFRAVKRNDGRLNEPLAGDGIAASVVAHCARAVRIAMARMRPHALRATAATNAPEHGADIAKVRRWLESCRRAYLNRRPMTVTLNP